MNYQNGKIYKIISEQTKKVYIGSTIQILSIRFGEHKRYKHYVTSQEILKFEDAKIELVENYSCNSKKELELREAYYIHNENCVNKYIPCRSKKEYREDNKEQIAEHMKQYRQEHRERIAEQVKQKFECPCGGRYRRGDKARHMNTQKHQKFLDNTK